MLFFLEMREDEPLPVPVEEIFAADRVENQSAARFERLEKQMHLRVVPQRFEMSDALDGFRDGFFVHDAPVVEPHVHAVALGNQADEDFRLHLSHDLRVDFAVTLVPDDVQERFLLLELLQLREDGARVHVHRQGDAVAEDGFEVRMPRAFLRPESLTGVGSGKSRDGADIPCAGTFEVFELRAGIEADAGDLFLRGFRRSEGEIGQRLADVQRTARDLEVGQADAAFVVRDFVDFCPENTVFGTGRFGRVLFFNGVLFQRGEERIHAVEPETAPEEAREQFPFRDETGDVFVRDRAGVEVGFQNVLVGHGDAFGAGVPVGIGEVDASRPEIGVQPAHDVRRAADGEVHFRDEDKRRDVIPLKQVPEGLRVRLHAVRAADDENGAVEDGQRPLGFGGEVDVSGGVEQGNAQPVRLDDRLFRENGDPAFAFQLVRVEVGVAPVDAAELFDLAGGV